MRNEVLPIALLLDSERACDQLRLIGVFTYIRAHAPNWKTTLLPDHAAAETAVGCIADEWHARQAARLAKSRIPTVAMDIRADEFPKSGVRVTHVKVDNGEIAAQAMSHFDAMGTFQAFVYVHDPDLSEWSVLRERRFRKDAARRTKTYFALPHPSSDAGAQLTQVLSRQSKPVAVFCANDKCASDVMNVCKAAELKVPAQVALLGVDNNTFLCDCCEPSLSSVAPDFEREGFLAAKELDRLLRRPQTPARSVRLVRTDGIVVRSSTRPGYSAEILVQTGVDFIRANFSRKISVLSVARAMGVSRRLSELRFRQVRGTSIGAFIADVRIRHAQHLLKTTKMPLDEIARDCGFSNASYLAQAFKRQTGATPRTWATAAVRSSPPPARQ